MAGLKKRQVCYLKAMLNSITPDIPCEFQRKTFDIDAIAKWKATQYRFFLLSCSSTVLSKVLSKEYYRHYLLLFVACRILNKAPVTLAHCDYAQNLLRKWFYLLPSLYGEKSQVLSMHYLIHITDDVKNLKLPLSDLSAFWGESYVSFFEKLVESPKKPLTQIVNRLWELESRRTSKIKRKLSLDKCVFKIENTYNYGIEYISCINVNNFRLTCVHPDNVVQLRNERIVKIDAILTKRENIGETLKQEKLYVLGKELLDVRETFDYPISSKQVGIYVGSKFSETTDMYCIKDVMCKCVLLHIDNMLYVNVLLHT